MFIDRYLSNNKLKLLYSTYKSEYIEELNEDNFIKVYELFREYNFYFIDDIILNYLEIFELNPIQVEIKILELNKKMGKDFIYIIGSDLRNLEIMLD